MVIAGDIARVTESALDEFGAIDAAVNNAGGIPRYAGYKTIFDVDGSPGRTSE